MGEHLFERLARERNITVEEMRAIISARIENGWNDPNPEKRAQWRKIPCERKIPTPDEWLRYAVEKLQEEGRDDWVGRLAIVKMHIEHIKLFCFQNKLYF